MLALAVLSFVLILWLLWTLLLSWLIFFWFFIKSFLVVFVSLIDFVVFEFIIKLRICIRNTLIRLLRQVICFQRCVFWNLHIQKQFLFVLFFLLFVLVLLPVSLLLQSFFALLWLLFPCRWEYFIYWKIKPSCRKLLDIVMRETGFLLNSALCLIIIFFINTWNFPLFQFFLLLKPISSHLILSLQLLMVFGIADVNIDALIFNVLILKFFKESQTIMGILSSFSIISDLTCCKSVFNEVARTQVG